MIRSRGDAHPRVCVCVLSCVRLFATSWSIAHQAPLSMGISRQESRGSSQLGDRTHISCVSCIGRWILYHCATWKAHPSKSSLYYRKLHFLKMASAFSNVGGAQSCVQPCPLNFVSCYYRTMVYMNLHVTECIALFSCFAISSPIGHENWLDCSLEMG